MYLAKKINKLFIALMVLCFLISFGETYAQSKNSLNVQPLKIPLELNPELLKPGKKITVSASMSAACTGGGNQSVGGFMLCANEMDAEPEMDRNDWWNCCAPPNWLPSEAYEFNFPSIESEFPCVAGATVDELILTITINSVTFDLTSPYACCEEYLEGLYANLYDDCPIGNDCGVAGDGLVNNANPGTGDCTASGDHLVYDGPNSTFPLGIPFTSTTTCLNTVIGTNEELGVDIIPSFRYDEANNNGCNCPQDLISQGFIEIEYDIEVEYVFCSNDLPNGCYPATFMQIDPLCESDPSINLPTTSDNGYSGTWSPPSIDPTGQGGNTITAVFTPDAGQCIGGIAEMDVVIDEEVVPTFTQIGPLCDSDPPVPLPFASNEGVTGSWDVGTTFDPAGQGGNTVTINFTPDAGQCASTQTMDIDVAIGATPTFNQIGPLCESEPPLTLPGTSINGISGTWDIGFTFDPAGQGGTTVTITFTPNPGECAPSATMDIVVNEELTPNFTQIGPLCESESPVSLPSTSNNGVDGSWDVGTTFDPNGEGGNTVTITFTPDVGECATTQTMDITVNEEITPSFTQIGPLCESDPPISLPNISDNGVSGTWDVGPSFDPNGQGGNVVTITFTPDAGECATMQTMDITVELDITPLFTQIGPLCELDPPVPLPDVSDNGIMGAWDIGTTFDPQGLGGTTTTIIFTPDPDECAPSVTMDISVADGNVPEFVQLPEFCEGDPPILLPTTSVNGFTGMWDVGPTFDPSGLGGSTVTINFMPDPGQCAESLSMDIDVAALIDPSFDPIGPFCEDDDPFVLPTSSNEGITGIWDVGPSFDPSGLSGVNNILFLPDFGQCANAANESVTVNDVPVYNIIEVACNMGLADYFIDLQTDGNNVASSAGTVIDNGGGSFLVDNVPQGVNVLITVSNTATGCEVEFEVQAPTCGCPNIAPPIGQDVEICENEPLAALSAMVGAGLEIDWYDSAVGGVLLLDNSTTYLPPMPGVYYAETIEPISECTSNTRTAIELIVLPVDTTYVPVTTCDSLLVGIDTMVISTATCDSVVITTTTLLEGHEFFFNATSCDPNDVGVDTAFFINQNGCDSLIVTSISLSLADTTFVPATTCDPLLAGVDTMVFMTNTCDSVVITTTTLLESHEFFFNATSCDPNDVGVDTAFFINQNGCDSLIVTSISLSLADTTFVPATTCDPLLAGVDTMVFMTNTCDSVVITTTTLLNNSEFFTTDFSCDPNDVGTDTLFLTNQFGCDSLIITNTILSVADTMLVPATTCDPLLVGVDTTVFTTSTCDSVVITTTALLESHTFFFTASSCDPNNVGVDTAFFVNQNGCDSLLITNTTLSDADTMFVPATTCNPMLVGNDTTVYSTNTCDSVVITITTLLDSDEVFLTASSCDPNDVGIDTLFLVNQNGCDSLVITVTSFSAADTILVPATTCDPLMVGVDTTVFTTSTCDSVVITTTILLNSSEVFLTATSCDQGQVGIDTLFLMNQNGCDSLVITNTIFEGINPTFLFASTCDMSEVGIDTTVFLVGNCDSLVIVNTAFVPSSEIVLTNSTCLVSEVGLDTVTLVNQGGCDSLVITNTVLQGGITNANITIVDPDCDDPFGSIEISEVMGGQPPFLYSIDGGVTFSTDPLFELVAAGNYSILLEDASGCQYEDQVLLTGVVPPGLSFNPSVIELFLGETATLSPVVIAPSADIATIEWTPVDNLSCVDCLEPQATPFGTTEYVISIVDENGCQANASIVLVVSEKTSVFTPDAFSPNDDSINDVFTIYANEGLVESVTFLKIFDRWGGNVFESYDFPPNDQTFGWDGKNDGEPVGLGVYVFLAEVRLINGKTVILEGGITVIR